MSELCLPLTSVMQDIVIPEGMSIQDLFDEMLERILLFLPFTEMMNCRRVCRRWRDAVDNLPDSFWKRKCTELNSPKRDYISAQSKYALTWRATYKALNSWNYIEQLPMTVQQPLPCTKVNGFQLLQNGIIALFKTRRPAIIGGTDRHGLYVNDTVVYYDLKTKKKCGKKEYDFYFIDYMENEYFTVLQQLDGSLHVVTKTDQCHSIIIPDMGPYILPPSISMGLYKKFTLLGDEIYSYSASVFKLSKITEVQGDTILQTKVLPNPSELKKDTRIKDYTGC